VLNIAGFPSFRQRLQLPSRESNPSTLNMASAVCRNVKPFTFNALHSHKGAVYHSRGGLLTQYRAGYSTSLGQNSEPDWLPVAMG
jgi:hypothetical protein